MPGFGDLTCTKMNATGLFLVALPPGSFLIVDPSIFCSRIYTKGVTCLPDGSASVGLRAFAVCLPEFFASGRLPLFGRLTRSWEGQGVSEELAVPLGEALGSVG